MKILTQKMEVQRSSRYWLASGFLNLSQSLFSVLISFTSFYFLVRLLDKHNYGTLTLFLSTTTFLEFSRNGITSNALIKYLSHAAQDDKKKIISASMTLNGVITLVCILFNVSFAHYLSTIWHSPELAMMLYMHTAVFLFSGITNQLNCIEQANLSFKGVFINSIAGSGINLLYVLSCSFLGVHFSLTGYVAVYICSAIVSVFISYSYVKRYFSFSRSLEWSWVKKLFGYGKYSFGTNLGAMVFNSIDQWMLGGILSAAAAGAYNIAIRITNLVEIPTGSVAKIVFPQSSRRMETQGLQGIKYLYEKSVGTIQAILLPGLLILFVFSRYIIDIIAGEKYEDAVPILRVTIFFCLFIPYARQFGTIMDSIGKPKLNFMLTALVAALNVLLNFVFIETWGVIGAAYATLISSMAGFIAGQIILRRHFGVNFLNTFIYAMRFYPELYGRYWRG